MNIKSHKIKTLFKAFIPPILISIKNYFGKTRQESNTWAGNYSSWQEVENLVTGYDNSVILEKCKDSLLKVKNGEAIYERDSVLFDKIQYSWGLLAGLLKAASENEGTLCVLDFGGSLGSTYFQNKDFLGTLKKLEWCIVEQQHFVNCGKEKFENKNLRFYYTIDDCMVKHEPDVLLLSSVLPYLDDPKKWLKSFNNSRIKYIIVDRTSLSETENNILTLQKVPEGIYNASYPCWFFGKNYIESQLDNYTLISDFDSAFDPSNYLLNNTISAHWGGYLFVKK